MSSESARKSSREKVQEYRARKRAQGYRLMQRWVPDVDSEEFRREARRQSVEVATSPAEKEDQEFVDAVSWLTDRLEDE